jgi:hypothetical protein
LEAETKKLAGRDQTFIRHAVNTLSGVATPGFAKVQTTTLDRATASIDRWYRANPSQPNKPVLVVIWREIAKARPAAEK